VADATPAAVLAAARERGLTIATAESLTGGLVAAELTSVPGASDVFVGGVVSYAIEVKRDVLRIPVPTLADHGPVSEPVALAMAEGVRDLLRVDVAVATTGVAGPEPHGGREPGTYCIAAVGPSGVAAFTDVVRGDRDAVRRSAANRAIQALCDVLDSAGCAGTSVG